MNVYTDRISKNNYFFISFLDKKNVSVPILDEDHHKTCIMQDNQ